MSTRAPLSVRVTDISYSLYALIYSREKNYRRYKIFSANNPSSCCPKCKGLGESHAIPDDNKTLAEGGILYYKGDAA